MFSVECECVCVRAYVRDRAVKPPHPTTFHLTNRTEMQMPSSEHPVAFLLLSA